MLHHSALWLWPPNVLDAMADGFLSGLQPAGRDRLGHRPGWGRRFRDFTLRNRLSFFSLLSYRLHLRPAERFTGDQHPVHDYRQFTRQRHAGFLVRAAFANTPCPILDRMGLADNGQKNVSRFIKKTA